MQKYVKIYIGADAKLLGVFHTDRIMELRFKGLFTIIQDFFGSIGAQGVEITFEFTDEFNS